MFAEDMVPGDIMAHFFFLSFFLFFSLGLVLVWVGFVGCFSDLSFRRTVSLSLLNKDR